MTLPVAPAVEVPASLTPLSLVYVFCAPLPLGLGACFSRQLSVVTAEELPSAQSESSLNCGNHDDRQVTSRRPDACKALDKPGIISLTQIPSRGH